MRTGPDRRVCPSRRVRGPSTIRRIATWPRSLLGSQVSRAEFFCPSDAGRPNDEFVVPGLVQKWSGLGDTWRHRIFLANCSSRLDRPRKTEFRKAIVVGLDRISEEKRS